MTEAGWYYAQGDPPGTVRRWNGSEWIGFAITQPTVDGSTPRSGEGVAPFKAYAGQVSLKGSAVAAQIALILVALANVYFGISLIQFGKSTVGLVASTVIGSDSEAELNRVASATALSVRVTFVTGILVIIWFARAYRNMSLWHKNRRSGMWTVLAWIVPLISFVRPVAMMIELAENSPRPDRKAALSPVPIIVWWITWLFVQFGMIFLFKGAGVDTHPSSLLMAMGVLQILSVVPALLAIYVVQGITDAQQERRVPSSAQLVGM